MRVLILVLLSSVVMTSCTNKIYVVRHAEKAAAEGSMSSTDPDLSEAGKLRAAALSQRLSDAGLKTIFVTKTVRSSATAGPAAAQAGLTLQLYNGTADSAFLNRVRNSRFNILIVGHSNTVDDIVNGLSGKKVVAGDLSESTFDRLYILSVKKNGKVSRVSAKTYGAPAP